MSNGELNIIKEQHHIIPHVRSFNHKQHTSANDVIHEQLIPGTVTLYNC